MAGHDDNMQSEGCGAYSIRGFYPSFVLKGVRSPFIPLDASGCC